MRRTLGFALLAALCTGGCNGGRPNRDTPGAGEAVPAASAVTIANAMGTCDDVAACARDCAGGNGESCRRLAVTYEFGKSDAGHDETLGTTYFDRACALGNASGCVSSGQMHEYGHGVPKDFEVAAAAYSNACTIGSQVGCANFAIMLENGRGVPKDIDRARALYDGACKAGAGLACDRLKFLSRDAAP